MILSAVIFSMCACESFNVKEKTHSDMFSNIIFISTDKYEPNVWDKETDTVRLGLELSKFPHYNAAGIVKQLDNSTNSIFLEMKELKSWVVIEGIIDDRIKEEYKGGETGYTLLFKRDSLKNNRVKVVFSRHYREWWNEQRPNNFISAACSFATPQRYEYLNQYLGSGYTMTGNASEVVFSGCVPQEK
jgi:hypothetical protein